MATQLPSAKGTPNFRPMSVVAKWIKTSLGMEVGLGSGDFVLGGDQLPPPQKGAVPPPQFSAHVHCGQTADGSRWHLVCRWALVQATLC